MSKEEYLFKNNEAYQKYISYALRHPEDTHTMKEEFFFSDQYRILFSIIKQFQSEKKTVSLDEVHIFAKHKDLSIELIEIKAIYDGYSDFSNIEDIKKLLRDSYLKEVTLKTSLEDILTKVARAGDLDSTKLILELDKLKHTVQSIDSKATLITSIKLAEDHKLVMDQREDLSQIKTFGYSVIDDVLTEPAAAEQISIWFGLSGSGKTSLSLSMLNRLIQRKVPVILFSQEMSVKSCMDRLIAMRAGIDLKTLKRPGKSQRLRRLIDDAIDEVAEFKNFIVFKESGISINEMNTKIYQAKDEFSKFGILPSDEYCFIISDLLTMTSDFGDFRPQTIEQAMNKTHNVIKNHNSHLAGIVQSNENKLRDGKPFKEPEDIFYFKLRREDIKGGAAIYERSRVVFSLVRKKPMLMDYFPARSEEWSLLDDILEVHCIKENEGESGHLVKFLFGENFKITPYINEKSGP